MVANAYFDGLLSQLAHEERMKKIETNARREADEIRANAQAAQIIKDVKMEVERNPTNKEYSETEETITLHGLGFLQVKLHGAQRLHVWHPELPRRTCCEFSSVHDHRFSFESRVLIGTQINTTFFPKQTREILEDELQPSGGGFSHIGYLHEGERTQFGNRPWLPHIAVDLGDGYVEGIPAGRSYHMGAYAYHSTTPGGDGRVATIMRKLSDSTDGVHSLCTIGAVPDVDFDRRQWPEEVLWDVVKDVLGTSSNIFKAKAMS